MKKYKVFDVVELYNENKATILNVEKETYKAEIVDQEGTSLGIKNICEEEIKKTLISK